VEANPANRSQFRVTVAVATGRPDMQALALVLKDALGGHIRAATA
jgi:hypothetical protein